MVHLFPVFLSLCLCVLSIVSIHTSVVKSPLDDKLELIIVITRSHLQSEKISWRLAINLK